MTQVTDTEESESLLSVYSRTRCGSIGRAETGIDWTEQKISHQKLSDKINEWYGEGPAGEPVANKGSISNYASLANVAAKATEGTARWMLVAAYLFACNLDEANELLAHPWTVEKVYSKLTEPTDAQLREVCENYWGMVKQLKEEEPKADEPEARKDKTGHGLSRAERIALAALAVIILTFFFGNGVFRGPNDDDPGGSTAVDTATTTATGVTSSASGIRPPSATPGLSDCGDIPLDVDDVWRTYGPKAETAQPCGGRIDFGFHSAPPERVAFASVLRRIQKQHPDGDSELWIATDGCSNWSLIEFELDVVAPGDFVSEPVTCVRLLADMDAFEDFTGSTVYKLGQLGPGEPNMQFGWQG